MYTIGIDGGGTGTVAVIAEADGTILTSVQGPPSNYLAVGEENAQSALQQVIMDVIKAGGKNFNECQMVVFGLAGMNNDTQFATVHKMITNIGFTDEKISINNDIVIAWAAATRCKPGLVVIAGTGSSAYGVNAKNEHYKSLGWDYILADQGSGYWVGLQGLQNAIKMWDGRLPKSHLLQAMVEFYQLKDPADMQIVAYSGHFSKPDIARFSREVARCAEAGDIVAQQILEQAGHELAQGVIAVVDHLEMTAMPFPVGLVGGTFRAGHWLLDTFTRDVQAFAPQATIVMSDLAPALGAVMYSYYLRDTLDDSIIHQIETTGAQAIRWKS